MPLPSFARPKPTSNGKRTSDPTRITIGTALNGKKLTVPRDFLKSCHTHIRGRTRQGKTSLSITQLVFQLLKTYPNSGGQPTRDAFLVIDLGGDRGFFNTVRRKVEEINKSTPDAPRKFRYFTHNSERSHTFDPIQSVPHDEKRSLRLCNLLVEAFHIDHGLDYGGNYFTQKNLLQLLSVADQAVRQNKLGKDATIQDLVAYIDANPVKDGDQIKMILTFLSRYEHLTPAQNPEFAIDMKQLITNQEFVYFFLPTLGEATTSRQIAGLALYSAVNAAMELADVVDESGLSVPPTHLHVFVDEFQEVAGRSFAALLAQSLKFNVSLYCANQTTEQLKSRDANLADVVRDNTALKIYYTVTGKEDIDELQNYSKDVREHLENERDPGGGFMETGGTGRAEFITRKLSRETILDVSDTFGHCLVHISDGTGHKEPVPVRQKHLTTKAEHEINKRTPIAPIPLNTDDDSASPTGPLWERQHREEPTAERAAWQQALRKLRLKKEAAARLSV